MQCMFFSLKNKGCDVSYSREFFKEQIENSDYVILTSSIICHETEIETLKKLNEMKKKIFVIGVFANVVKDKYN